MLSAAFNAQEVVERLEQANAPHALAVAMAQLLQEVAQIKGNAQSVQIESSEPSTQTGTPSVQQYPADALLRLERKVDDGFIAVNTRFDKLQAEMDRRFEASKADTALQLAQVDKRFGGIDAKIDKLQTDTDRRFELLLKEVELSRKDLLIKLGGTMAAVGTLLFAALRFFPAA